MKERSIHPARSSSRRDAAFGVLCIATASAAAANPASASPSSIVGAPVFHPRHRPSAPLFTHPRLHTSSLAIGKLRGGGADDGGAVVKKKRKGKSSKKSHVPVSEEASTSKEADAEEEATDAKGAINDAMKETDAATALGDAIRDRADLLRKDRLPYPERTFDGALVSLGLSLGTAGTDKDASDAENSEGGGAEPVDAALAYYQYGHKQSISRSRNGQNDGRPRIQPSTSALIGNYFLKTHGGTHLVQCLLSLLASVLGVACLIMPAFPSSAAVSGGKVASKATNAKLLSRKILLSTVKYQLMQQTLLLAMAKHASALFGAVFLGASRIPQLGIRNVRKHLESVALDPVGQYLFYCALLVVWMGWFGGSGGGMGEYLATLRGSTISIINAGTAAAATMSDVDGASAQDGGTEVVSQLLNTLSQTPPPWFLSQSYGLGSIVPILILAPILLREIISILWVFSDVLTLAINSSGGMTGKLFSGILTSCRSVLDAFMSILITSDKWRKADSFTRQRTLASLVSRFSLITELGVGGVLIGDAIQSFWTFAFVGSASVTGGRIPFKCVLGKMACAHLYLNFLLSRRKKIATIVGSIRGGAILDRVLDVLVDPKKEMGLFDDDDGMGYE